MIGRRELVAQKYAEGKGQQEIARELGYKSPDSVNQALRHPAVQERIQFNRNEMFKQSKIDRVKLLKDIYGRITTDHAEIFKVLRGEGEYLAVENLEKLTPVQSRLIQQVECQGYVVTKIRFHSQDVALKIISKAAGFEDSGGAGEEAGGAFRGLIIEMARE